MRTADACPGAPEPRTLAQLEAKVSGDAVLLMDRADHQATYGRLGQTQFDRANELMRWAAIAAGIVMAGVYACAQQMPARA
ncbi:MAG: hypothetical protein U1D66_13135, partial [Erythrobacter sp.]|nr:hypothetical protein [Erythrobacter sp.]